MSMKRFASCTAVVVIEAVRCTCLIYINDMLYEVVAEAHIVCRPATEIYGACVVRLVANIVNIIVLYYKVTAEH